MRRTAAALLAQAGKVFPGIGGVWIVGADFGPGSVTSYAFVDHIDGHPVLRVIGIKEASSLEIGTPG